MIQKRLKDADDELQIVIVKDMMLTGFDAPPLHTLYLDRPLKGALLMQTLARVNRTFRGKPDGLLVAYAPLAENLSKALAEYTDDRPGRRSRSARTSTRRRARRDARSRQLDELARATRGGRQLDGDAQSWIKAAVGLTNYLRSPATPGNQVGRRRGDRSATGSASWPTSSPERGRSAAGSQTLDDLRPTAQFYEEVRVWMGKFDAAGAPGRAASRCPRRSSGCSSALVATSTATGEIVDIYEAAGLPQAVAVRPRPRLRQPRPQAARTRTWRSRRCVTC